MIYLGVYRVLEEVNRVLKRNGLLFIMDYFRDDPSIWALDRHYPIANITTPLHEKSLRKILEVKGFSILYWDAIWKFFKGSEEGEKKVYVWGEGMVPLWKLLRDNIAFPVDYKVILAQKK